MKQLRIGFVIISLLISACESKLPEQVKVATGIVNSNQPDTQVDAQLREGDIIFHASTSQQSKAIQLVTHAKYSHVGIVLKKQGKWMVLEAVQPVKYTALRKWIKRGEKGEFVVKRLKTPQQLDQAIILDMKNKAKRYLGKPYDSYFGWSNERIYCSELVWKLFKQVCQVELGEHQKLKDLDLAYPEVYYKLTQRYGNNIPWEEEVISPAAIFQSNQLVEVLLPIF